MTATVVFGYLFIASVGVTMVRTNYAKPYSRQESPEKGSPPLVGAIRWDAWHGALSDVGKAVEKTLTPREYHHRLPWFAQIDSDGVVRIRGDDPKVLEQEVIYARQAGLDFWAFVTYPEDNPLSLPLLWFLDFPSRRGLKFCNIVEWERFGGRSEHRELVNRLVRYFNHPAYVRVMGQRPLLFLLANEDSQILQQWGSLTAFRQVTETLRQEAKSQGAGNPYIVAMNFQPSRAAQICSQVGADAISAYAIVGGSEKGAPFSEALAQMKKMWREMIRFAPAVPIVSFGWDPRPRINVPVPWYPNYPPMFFETFSPRQCAEALREAIEFVKLHPDRCPSNTIIIYAWNEFDEGGWLCPTLGADGKPDVRRVQATGRLLRSYLFRKR